MPSAGADRGEGHASSWLTEGSEMIVQVETTATLHPQLAGSELTWVGWRCGHEEKASSPEAQRPQAILNSSA